MPTFFPILFGCCCFALKPYLPVLMFLPTCFVLFCCCYCYWRSSFLGVIRFICLLWQASCCWTVSLFIAFELNKLPILPLCVEYPEQLICLQQKYQIKESYCFKRTVLYLYIVSITFATPYKYYGFVNTKTAPPKSTFKELLKPSWLHRLKAISHNVKEEIVTLHKY